MTDFTKSDEVAEFFRKQGRNIIPIEPGSKRPIADEDEVMKWKREGCNEIIKEGDPIAMLHGEKSGTWAVDCDDSKILDEFLTDKSKKKNMFIVKTPQNGHHFIWERDPNDYPEKDYVFFDSKKRRIDIRQKGYTLIPPSDHPKTELGKYQFLTECYTPVKMKWSNFLTILHGNGFFSAEDREESGEKGKKYDYTQLIAGGYKQGNRRVKQKSLYIQKRMMGSTEEESVLAVTKVNDTCIPPIDEKEFRENMRSAERYYSNVVKPDIETQPVTSKETKKQKYDLYEFADIIMEKHKFVTTDLKEIYHYSNGIYRLNGEFVISQTCRKIWREINIDTKDVTEITKIIMDATGYISINDFDPEHTKINMKNGMYDITTGELTEHTPEYLSLTQYDVFYNSTKKCPKFLKFLSKSLEKDYVKMRTNLEMMALCFIPRNIIEKAYIHVGAGSNGKSTLFNILTAMLGINNITAKTIHDFENNRFSAAALEGKAANISADVGKKGIKNTELIKKLIGGDPVDSEKKFKGAYAFRPNATMIFSANELPEVDDSSDGFARKFELIKWDKKFYGKDRDHSIKQIQYDSSEKSGIMNLLLPIMRRLIRTQKLRYESTVEMTKNEWIRESDSISKFLEDRTTKEASYIVRTEIFYNHYRKYCVTGKHRIQTRQKFNLKMRDEGLEIDVRRIDGNSTKVWVGINLTSEIRAKNQVSLIEEDDE